jgi:hypothetical protein
VDVIGGTPIHHSIPTKNIRSIADAATGTGYAEDTIPIAMKKALI